ncbi:MAG TPA: radical SAM family heme chaperone HemW [Terracidiphilus sp.]|jgi:oxygen-independent coproporphyrinogen-3 oxidase|nr:radical SAM family heme chaperone HemW [Terracidiphilus sp.]
MRGNTPNSLGIYISIPFCRSKCTYCNFASGVYPASRHAQYVDRVIEDLRGAAAWAAQVSVDLPRGVDTVYLGGGTPSLLEPELFTRLFAALRDSFDLEADAEITVECAPGQLADATLAAMVAAGVNRVSLGVQSFVDREAQVSGRLHTRAIVEQDLRRLRAAGIANLNVDLIAGLAGQTPASWDESLDALLAADLPHASVYMLEIDEESRLGREMLNGGARYYAELVPTDDAIADMYAHAIERLAQAGLAQYEISNFSTAGFQSRHNLRYWQRRPYLGVGLDASSALPAAAEPVAAEPVALGPLSGPRASTGRAVSAKGRGSGLGSGGSAVPRDFLRATTTDNLEGYLAGSATVETAWLAPAQQLEEAWFLGLRLNSGVHLRDLEDEFGADAVAAAIPVVEQLAADGLVHAGSGTVRLTPCGRMVSNEVFQQFLGLGASRATELASAHRD